MSDTSASIYGAARQETLPGGDHKPHQEVARYIRRKITSGHWKLGEALPGISELAAEYDVSPAAIRDAVVVLAKEGLLIRQPGKGDFVVATVQGKPFVPSAVIRWGNLVASSGAGSNIKLLPPEVGKIPEPDVLTRDRLGSAMFARSYMRLYRANVYRDKPVALSDTYLDERLYSRWAHDFDTYAILGVLDRLSDVRIKDGFQFFKVVKADVETAWHLNITPDDPIGETSMWLIDTSNTIIYQARHSFPTEFVNFRFDLSMN